MNIQKTRLSERKTRIAKKFALMKKTANDALNLAIDIGTELILAKGEVARGEWTVWQSENLPFNRVQASRYIRIATHGAQAKALEQDADDPLTINELCELLPKTKEEPVITEADADKLAYAGLPSDKKSRDSDDWQTPHQYIEDARDVLGGIDLDPFSSTEANETVGARHFLTLADDAHATPWAGPDIKTVWMNPPYGRGAMAPAVDRFIDQYRNDAFAEGVVLTNASTDAYWYHALLRASSAVCQTRGRIAFISRDKTLSSNTKGQAFFYFGQNPAKFIEVFSKHGWCVSTGGYND